MCCLIFQFYGFINIHGQQDLWQVNLWTIVLAISTKIDVQWILMKSQYIKQETHMLPIFMVFAEDH